MSNSEANVLNVREEDKDFIRLVATLTPDERALIKGVVIGLQLQEEQPAKR